MRRIALLATGAAFAVALVPGPASACQWEIYYQTYETPVGEVTLPMAHCVAP